jgi:hypothetical protein
MPTKHPTFEVDKTGLAKLLERRGREFVVAELLQNSWDENASRVDVTLKPAEGDIARDYPDHWHLIVEDDNPEGFTDLAHAYTLFAESEKKDDPTKRGRFNLGEKLVIALCAVAEISTTKGRIVFDGEGREMFPATRDAGSRFTGLIPMDAGVEGAVRALVESLIVPEGIATYYNGKPLTARVPVATFDASLRTERADAEGFLRPTTRKTTVAVYEPQYGERGTLYEMGIPVVETGDRWHVDVGQKVPLNTDRDNVPPYYLRDVRALTLNVVADQLRGPEAAEPWVSDAIEDEQIEPAALQAVVRERFGPKAVIADPSDREAEKIAVGQGYTVVSGGALSRPAWKNIKQAGVLRPAGDVTPSPDPDEDADNLELIAPEHWPESVKRCANFAVDIAAVVLDAEIRVEVVNDMTWQFVATYGQRDRGKGGLLRFNLAKIGYKAFDMGPLSERMLELVIHELAHHWARDHLSREFYDACCKIGARIVRARADHPEMFARYEAVPVG